MPLVFATFLREDGIEIKNKEWNAGEKPEEKSLRSTLTYFKGDYCLKKTMTVLLSAASFILMPWRSKLTSAIFKATETLGGTPVILGVRHHGIIKSLAYRRKLRVNMSDMF